MMEFLLFTLQAYRSMVKAKMPVLCMGCVVSLEFVTHHPVPLNQTGFLTLTQKPLSSFFSNASIKGN